jgi:hypothetical protein
MTRRRSILLLSCLVASAPGTPGLVRADEPADDKARAAEFLRFANREAKAYTLHRAEARGEGPPFQLHPEPVLRWTNPILGSVSGGLYLWTDRGRPEAVAAIFQWHERRHYRTNEFQSLSPGLFVMDRGGEPVWTPRRPGIELKPLPESPAPAGTPAQRLRQMRELARGFTANQSDHKGEVRALRLLTQPVHRFEGSGGDPIDGGLFVFVMGTDPEAFLLIEARPAGNAPRWDYALARMSHAQTLVSHRGRAVWNVPLLDPSTAVNPQEPYTKFRFEVVE